MYRRDECSRVTAPIVSHWVQSIDSFDYLLCIMFHARSYPLTELWKTVQVKDDFDNLAIVILICRWSSLWLSTVSLFWLFLYFLVFLSCFYYILTQALQKYLHTVLTCIHTSNNPRFTFCFVQFAASQHVVQPYKNAYPAVLLRWSFPETFLRFSSVSSVRFTELQNSANPDDRLRSKPHWCVIVMEVLR